MITWNKKILSVGSSYYLLIPRIWANSHQLKGGKEVKVILNEKQNLEIIIPDENGD